jgi:hypothetical protein
VNATLAGQPENEVDAETVERIHRLKIRGYFPLPRIFYLTFCFLCMVFSNFLDFVKLAKLQMRSPLPFYHCTTREKKSATSRDPPFSKRINGFTDPAAFVAAAAVPSGDLLDKAGTKLRKGSHFCREVAAELARQQPQNTTLALRALVRTGIETSKLRRTLDTTAHKLMSWLIPEHKPRMLSASQAPSQPVLPQSSLNGKIAEPPSGARQPCRAARAATFAAASCGAGAKRSAIVPTRPYQQLNPRRRLD